MHPPEAFSRHFLASFSRLPPMSSLLSHSPVTPHLPFGRLSKDNTLFSSGSPIYSCLLFSPLLPLLSYFLYGLLFRPHASAISSSACFLFCFSSFADSPSLSFLSPVLPPSFLACLWSFILLPPRLCYFLFCLLSLLLFFCFLLPSPPLFHFLPLISL